MAEETEVDQSVIYKLIGDGSSYMKMLKDAEKVTDTATSSMTDALESLKKEGDKLGEVGESLTGFKDVVDTITNAKLAGWVQTVGEKMGVLQKVTEEGTSSLQSWIKSGASVGESVLGLADKFSTLQKTIAGISVAGLASTFATSWTTALNSVKTAANAATTALAGMNLAALGKWGLIIGGVSLALYGLYKAADYFMGGAKEVNKVLEIQTKHFKAVQSDMEIANEEVLTYVSGLIRFEDRQKAANEALGSYSGELDDLRAELETYKTQLEEPVSIKWYEKVQNALGLMSAQDSAAILKQISAREKLVEAVRMTEIAIRQAQARVQLGTGYTPEEEGGIYQAGTGLRGQMEQQMELVGRAQEEFDRLNTTAGRWAENMWGNKALTNSRSFLEQQKELLEVMKQQEKALKDQKAGPDPKAIKMVDDLNAKLEMQRIVWGKTGDAAAIALGKVMGVDQVKLDKAQQGLNWIEARKQVESVEKSYKSFLKEVETSNATFGMSSDEIKLWTLEMEAAEKGITINEERLKRLKDALNLKMSIKLIDEGQEEMQRTANELIEKFKDPLVKWQEEVDALNAISIALPTDVYNKALADIDTRYLGIADSANKAKDAIKGVDAALVGSAEATARLMEYQERIAFKPQIAAAETWNPPTRVRYEEMGPTKAELDEERARIFFEDMESRRQMAAGLNQSTETVGINAQPSIYSRDFTGPLSPGQEQKVYERDAVKLLESINRLLGKIASQPQVEIEEEDFTD